MIQPMIEKYTMLPRAGKWGVYALVGIVGYFAVVEPLVSKAVAYSNRAASKEATLREWSGASDKRRLEESTVALGAKVYGDVSFPGAEGERSPATLSKIASVLRKQGVKEYDLRERPLLLKTGPLAAAVSGKQLRRVVRDVSFECKPEVLAALLAELEKSPEVTCVSRLSITPAGTGRAGNTAARGKMIKVSISVESWVQARENKV